MALTIGTGFVVDDAIVMIENIVRHMEEGESPFQAALKGASEIGFTIISLTLSLIAVFIPLLFMTGLVGRMFREFALTLSIAVVVSAIVSLTLTPMMCSRMLRQHAENAGNAVTRFFNDVVEWTVEVLSQHAGMGAAARGAHAAGADRHHGRDAVALHRHSQGLPAAAGHRPHLRGDGRRRRGLVRGDAAPARRGRGGGPQGSRGGGRRVGGRRHAGQRHAQRRAARDHAASARRAPHIGDDRDRPAAAGAAARPRRDPVLPAGAGHPDRDPHQPRAVPVHAHRHQRRRSRQVGA